MLEVQQKKTNLNLPVNEHNYFSCIIFFSRGID